MYSQSNCHKICILSGCNISCKTLFSERGNLPIKLICPASTSTCPATLLNIGEIGLCRKHYLPSRASQDLFQLICFRFRGSYTIVSHEVELHLLPRGDVEGIVSLAGSFMPHCSEEDLTCLTYNLTLIG